MGSLLLRLACEEKWGEARELFDQYRGLRLGEVGMAMQMHRYLLEKSEWFEGDADWQAECIDAVYAMTLRGSPLCVSLSQVRSEHLSTIENYAHEIMSSVRMKNERPCLARALYKTSAGKYHKQLIECLAALYHQSRRYAKPMKLVSERLSMDSVMFPQSDCVFRPSTSTTAERVTGGNWGARKKPVDSTFNLHHYTVEAMVMARMYDFDHQRGKYVRRVPRLKDQHHLWMDVWLNRYSPEVLDQLEKVVFAHSMWSIVCLLQRHMLLCAHQSQLLFNLFRVYCHSTRSWERVSVDLRQQPHMVDSEGLRKFAMIKELFLRQAETRQAIFEFAAWREYPRVVLDWEEPRVCRPQLRVVCSEDAGGEDVDDGFCEIYCEGNLLKIKEYIQSSVTPSAPCSTINMMVMVPDTTLEVTNTNVDKETRDDVRIFVQRILNNCPYWRMNVSDRYNDVLARVVIHMHDVLAGLRDCQYFSYQNYELVGILPELMMIRRPMAHLASVMVLCFSLVANRATQHLDPETRREEGVDESTIYNTVQTVVRFAFCIGTSRSSQKVIKDMRHDARQRFMYYVLAVMCCMWYNEFTCYSRRLSYQVYEAQLKAIERRWYCVNVGLKKMGGQDYRDVVKMVEEGVPAGYFTDRVEAVHILHPGSRPEGASCLIPNTCTSILFCVICFKIWNICVGRNRRSVDSEQGVALKYFGSSVVIDVGTGACYCTRKGGQKKDACNSTCLQSVNLLGYMMRFNQANYTLCCRCSIICEYQPAFTGGWPLCKFCRAERQKIKKSEAALELGFPW